MFECLLPNEGIKDGDGRANLVPIRNYLQTSLDHSVWPPAEHTVTKGGLRVAGTNLSDNFNPEWGKKLCGDYARKLDESMKKKKHIYFVNALLWEIWDFQRKTALCASALYYKNNLGIFKSGELKCSHDIFFHYHSESSIYSFLSSRNENKTPLWIFKLRK